MNTGRIRRVFLLMLLSKGLLRGGEPGLLGIGEVLTGERTRKLTIDFKSTASFFGELASEVYSVVNAGLLDCRVAGVFTPVGILIGSLGGLNMSASSPGGLMLEGGLRLFVTWRRMSCFKGLCLSCKIGKCS